MNAGGQRCTGKQRKTVLTEEWSVCCPLSFSLHHELIWNIVWRCPKANSQCGFFLWKEHEARARQWLDDSQRHSCPQTPTANPTSASQSGQPVNSSTANQYTEFQPLETLWTKALSKRKAGDFSEPIEIEDHSDGDDGGNKGHLRSTAVKDDPFTHSYQASDRARKSIRKSVSSTTRQQFTEKLNISKDALPFTSSRDCVAANNCRTPLPQRFQSVRTLSVSHGVNDTTSFDDGHSNLAPAVIELIRLNNLVLDASTEAQIRHKIGLVLDVGEAKLRRYEETIAELCRKLDDKAQN